MTREYKLLAVTDPVNGAVTLVALSLEDLGAINKFFVDKLLNPLGTLAASPLEHPDRNLQPPRHPADDTPQDVIDKNITIPIETLAAFPANLAAFVQSLFGGSASMSATGRSVAFAADPVTGLVSPVTPLQVLGAIDKFFVDKLLNPLGTLAASPLNIPTGISNLPATPADETPQDVIDKNITIPIETLAAFPAGLADLVRDILGGSASPLAVRTASLTTDPTVGRKKLAIPSITGAPGIITKATTNADLGKMDPDLGSKSSVTDAGAPQRKSAPRLVNLRTHSEDPTDTGQGGRHRLENISRSLRFTPRSRKLHERRRAPPPAIPRLRTPRGRNPRTRRNND